MNGPKPASPKIERGKILLLGSGAREHALGWKLSQSRFCESLIVAPGNDGMPDRWERWELNVNTSDPARLKGEYENLAKKAVLAGVKLVVVGPDQFLADGVVDIFSRHSLLCFGPTQAAAQIESSKAFAKRIMKKANVPTARFSIVKNISEIDSVFEEDWIKENQGACVVKADGLALGKGVRVCSSLSEAKTAASELIKISGQLVIEELLTGSEISWMAFCDGKRASLWEPARDYKRLKEDHEGPNTGGMGAFSPVPGIPKSWASRMKNEVFEPVLRVMNEEGTPFKGLLFAGLMIDEKKDRFWILEFNARFGDPETQVLLPRLGDDLVDWCYSVAGGDLASKPETVPMIQDYAVYVVAAAEGYPENPKKGDSISGEFRKDGFFCAGVKKQGDPSPKKSGFVTSGGRVLGALGVAADLGTARSHAYERMNEIRFDGMQVRQDIAADALDPNTLKHEKDRVWVIS